MKDTLEIIYGILIGLVVSFVMFVLIPSYAIEKSSKQKTNLIETAIKQEAIQLGYAEYNSVTGVWQWKTNVVVNE